MLLSAWRRGRTCCEETFRREVVFAALFQGLELKARNMFRSPMRADKISAISMYPAGNVACRDHGVLANVDLALTRLAQNVPDDTHVRCQSERGGWLRGGLTSNTPSLLCIIRQGGGRRSYDLKVGMSLARPAVVMTCTIDQF